MTREGIAKLAESFVAEYADPEIDRRMFFDRWADRRRLGDSVAAKLWDAVTEAQGDARFSRLARRTRLAGRR